MVRKFTLFLFSFIITVFSFAQYENTSYKTKNYTLEPATKVTINNIRVDWKVNIQNLESPVENNNLYRIFLKERKEEVRKRFPVRDLQDLDTGSVSFDADTVSILTQFEGNEYAYSVPNDNTLAISNDNFLISAINTNIYFYDLNQDSLMKTISLSAFSDTLDDISSHQYDPKLTYDPEEDRFIIVYLAGASSDNRSNIIVGFSQSNNPMEDWNLYALPGDAVSDTSWTDYPAIALTEDEVFITGNILEYGGSWQTSFRQSIIWQIDKHSGFSGQALGARLWYDIKHNNSNIRNIHPVKGGERLYGPDIYLLSNRNFDIQNDTIFMLHISGLQDDASAILTVDAVKSDKSYGMPPDARQDNSYLLATNDARVLGAFYHNGQIHFVSNTIDTLTGFSAVYHGILTGMENAPEIHGVIIGDSVRDFGYPNLSYSGKSLNDYQSIITFNHSSPETHAGFSAIQFKSTNEYSPITHIKYGGYWVHLISGFVERWGDYTGSQRKYNEAGTVWVSGSFAKLIIVGGGQIKKGINGTWIAEVKSVYDEDPFVPEKYEAHMFPNPSADILNVEFSLPEDKYIEISVFDIQGREVKKLVDQKVQRGKNVISFSTEPLKRGLYFLTIYDRDTVLLSSKFIVAE